MLNSIVNESCLDTLSRMADNSVDLVITSPPYNMNLRIRKGEYWSTYQLMNITNSTAK